MITFKQYLNEGRLGAAAALGIAGAAMAAPPPQNLPQIDRVLTGVVSAEHRGRLKGSGMEYDPSLYVRTGAPDPRAGGKPSSAYGPFQFTTSTIKDLSQRHPKTFAGSEEYVKSFVDQGNKMLKNPTDPKYGYGGSGDLGTEDNHAKYMDMSRAGLDAMAQDLKIDMSKPLSTDDESRLVQRFRGVPLEKSYKAAYEKGASIVPKDQTATTTTVKPAKTVKTVKTATQDDVQPTAPTTTDTHQVVSGDTLGAIAKKYGKSVQDMQKLNPDITNPNVIKPGQKIKTK